KVEFIFQEQLCDFELVIVAEAVEDNLFCDARKQFRAKRLLRTSQDVTLHRGKTGVLEAQQIHAADVRCENNVEPGQVKGFAVGHCDPSCIQNLKENIQNTSV